MEASAPHTCVRGLHPNWRIAQYEAGDYFAAHMDQADSLTLRVGDQKERLTSSHTVLVALSDRAAMRGGATRLFPTGKYDDSAIDVELPRGYALVFEQSLLHTGLAVTHGSKYILQSGLLRSEPLLPTPPPPLLRASMRSCRTSPTPMSRDEGGASAVCGGASAACG